MTEPAINKWCCEHCAEWLGLEFNQEGRYSVPSGYCGVGEHHVKVRLEWIGELRDEPTAPSDD